MEIATTASNDCKSRDQEFWSRNSQEETVIIAAESQKSRITMRATAEDSIQSGKGRI